VLCGLPGERCCPNGSCLFGLQCYAPDATPSDAASDVDDATHDVGDADLRDTHADDAPRDLADANTADTNAADDVVLASFGVCRECGGLGQPCCPTEPCRSAPGLRCVAEGDAEPRCLPCVMPDASSCELDGGRR
jgi:hypothetical protein